MAKATVTSDEVRELVERLRGYKPYRLNDGEWFGPKFCEQAADTILALQAEIERAVLAERERCAKVADGIEADQSMLAVANAPMGQTRYIAASSGEKIARQIAHAIREGEG